MELWAEGNFGIGLISGLPLHADPIEIQPLSRGSRVGFRVQRRRGRDVGA